MYFDDHPPPHFHVYYESSSAIVAIDSLEIISGSLPRRALALVVEWAIAHRPELREDWDLCVRHAALKPIEPLK